MRENLQVIGGMIGLVAITLAIVGTGMYFFDQKQCTARGIAMSVAHKHGFFEGCIIKTPGGRGQWVPLQNYRVQ